MTPPVLPGATIGILGSGQLGRMLALSARARGYGVAVFSPERDSPAGQLADREVIGAYDDIDAIRAFAGTVAVLTFEFENISSAAAEAAASATLVRPGGWVLHTSQQRVREKQWLATHGIPTAPFAVVRTAFTSTGQPTGRYAAKYQAKRHHACCQSCGASWSMAMPLRSRMNETIAGR